MACCRVVVSLDLPILTPHYTITGSAFLTALPSFDTRSVVIYANSRYSGFLLVRRLCMLDSVMGIASPLAVFKLIRNCQVEESALFMQGNSNSF